MRFVSGIRIRPKGSLPLTEQLFVTYQRRNIKDRDAAPHNSWFHKGSHFSHLVTITMITITEKQLNSMQFFREHYQQEVVAYCLSSRLSLRLQLQLATRKQETAHCRRAPSS